MYCKFARIADSDIKVPDKNETVEFDLNNGQFYILMAIGPVTNGNIGYHTGGRIVSQEAYGKMFSHKGLRCLLSFVFEK